MRREKRWERVGEGWLVAAALALLAAVFLGIWLNRLPRSMAVEPVRFVSAEELEVRVDLNSAGAAELAALPGIGEGLAERIVAYRAENGPFESVDGLDGVPGIGEGKIEMIRSLVICG